MLLINGEIASYYLCDELHQAIHDKRIFHQIKQIRNIFHQGQITGAAGHETVHLLQDGVRALTAHGMLVVVRQLLVLQENPVEVWCCYSNRRSCSSSISFFFFLLFDLSEVTATDIDAVSLVVEPNDLFGDFFHDMSRFVPCLSNAVENYHPLVALVDRVFVLRYGEVGRIQHVARRPFRCLGGCGFNWWHR